MFGAEVFDFSLWWIFPLVMIVLCFIMMRGCRSSMMCGFGPWSRGRDRTGGGDSAKRILEERYAKGDIDLAEYEKKRKVLDGE